MRTKQTSKRIRTLRRRRLALALVTAMAAPMALAQNMPESGNVTSGSATITNAAFETTIAQTTKGAIIDWGSFNIGFGYGVTFNQQFGASSVTLNRVIGSGYGGPTPSSIDGTLTSNGNVFIINPSGITFGSSAQVNVGGLVASTLALTDPAFLNGVATGSYQFSGATGTTTVRNNGNITAGAGGVAFVGTTVWNSGSITANGGNIAFGGGDVVTLDFVGDGLTQVTILVPPTTDSAVIQDRNGSMTADGGSILLRSAATAGGTGGGVFASGSLRAQSIGNLNGRIELTSAGGPAMVGAPGIFSDAGSPFTNGNIDVSGGNGERGGSVLISGSSVFLVNNDPTPLTPSYPASTGSVIDASGGLGGGDITITSTGSITALELTRIDASGIVNGSGGTVDLSANGGSVALYGDILALGGKVSGNGGRIGINARDNINQTYGTVNASANAGNGGQIGLITTTGDIYATDLDASGLGNGGGIVGTAGGNIGLYGYANANGQNGNGGSISFTAQGVFTGLGTLDASGGVNGGSIYLGGTDSSGFSAGVDVGGTIDASGASGNGGIVTFIGNGAVRVTSDINASGGTNGGEIHLHGTDSTYFGGVYVEGGTLDASGTNGNGGLIDVYATGDVYLGGDLLAWGGVDGGAITLVGAAVDFTNALAYGTAGKGGSVSVTANDISLVSSANSIDVHGQTGGGSIDLEARNSLVLGELSSLSADTGSSGNGGSIRLHANNSLVAYGDLSARGVSGGGSIYTGSGGTIDLNGIGIDAGTVSGNAGTWTIAAPQMDVLNGSAQGTVATGPVPATTTNIQDGDLNNAFATGTNIVLQANAGDVIFGNPQFGAVQVTAAFSSPLFLHVNATGAIRGAGFSIGSTVGALEMLFNADSAGGNANGGYIDFTNASLSSNGGLIAMYGQSDQASGFATGFANGISLVGVDVDTAGGGVVLSGYSTGSGSGTGYAGVYMDGTNLYSGGGNVSIHGTGAGNTSGVIASNGLINTSGASVLIEGRGEAGDGIRLDNNGIDSAGGDITLLGYGGAIGVYGTYSDLVSGGGDILVHGEGGTGNGIDMDSRISSAGGLVTFYGHSVDATGLDFGGYVSGITSAGGDISLTGIGETGGVLLHSYAAADIDSGGGQLAVTGTAYATDAVGVYLDGIRLLGSTGDVTVNGSSPAGVGVLFANGAGITTTSGAISLIGEGANFGLDLGDGALATASGDIYLSGTALASGATAGVRMTGGGITTNGGDITVIGTSAGGVGVQLGNGGAFAIGSGGGAITINGTGIDAGVVMQGNQVNSGGGAVGITGTGAAIGVSLDGSSIDSAGGDIGIDGTASASGGTGVSLINAQLRGGAGDVTVRGTAAAGSGLLLSQGAGITTTTGAINLYGTGADFGLVINNGALKTDSGNILLEGVATATTATAGVRVTGNGLVTNGGDITVTGTSAGGVGVQLGNGGAFAIGSGGGAITIDGTGIDAGVVMQGNQVTSGGGAVGITGTGAAIGVSLNGSDIDSAGGAISISGTASAAGGTGVDLTNARLRAGAGNVVVLGNAAAGTGIGFGGASTISTTSGGISLTGIGADVGLLINGNLTTDSGHFDLRGRGTGSASNGLVIGQGVSIKTNGGGIELSGEGGSGAGISSGSGSLVDAGNSLIVLRAANDGSSDAIRLLGGIHSNLGVNLRPGGVDANGGLTDHVNDEIRIGGTTGFALSGAELAMIDAPELVIGSSLHAGAIRVLTATSRNGNLTLQNNGGSGGIDLQAAVNVGNGTLALSTGGSVTQTSAGAISAHSLLANAGGDVLLATAQNNVASTTLGGSAGGQFQFLDVDGLAIGNVSAIGFNASSGSLSSLSAAGIRANGDVFVQSLAGDLILNSNVVGNNITLVTAGRLQNLGNASLIASGDWRVWANTWVGETRGGLVGSGALPNLYGCAFNGACGVTVPLTDNHFIYVQQPTAVITFDSFSREYGLANPSLTYSVTGAILGDTAANVASGTASTTATIASNVGNYAISGNFTSASGYRFQLVPGTLAITPATLFFTADPSLRYLGSPNPTFTGTVTGFRNGDTQGSVFGPGNVWSSPAGFLSPVGFYAINGGTTARNYVFAQASGNARALQIIPLPQLTSTPTEFIRETINTYVYDRNFGGAPVCAVNTSLDDQKLASTGDDLSTEWSKVRSRPNLTNCFETESKNGCGSF